MPEQYCSYYQAYVWPPDCGFVVAILKSADHVVFDRSLDKENSIIEFFVPPSMEQQFLDLMRRFEKDGLVANLTKLPNRLLDEHAEL